MSWILIRHGMTQGNLERRYVGCRTDEPLCAEGIARLKQGVYPEVRKVYASPMKRCTETAAILYPTIKAEIIPDFRECDFGEFEYQNYEELNGRADYQAWIDSGGELPFPGGESRASFAARSLAAFRSLLPGADGDDCALIVHGAPSWRSWKPWPGPRETTTISRSKTAADTSCRRTDHTPASACEGSCHWDSISCIQAYTSIP